MNTLETIEVLGFDRIGFVDEITKTVGNYAQIKQIRFDADGVKAQGQVVFQINDKNEFDSMILRIKSIAGLVKVVRFL